MIMNYSQHSEPATDARCQIQDKDRTKRDYNLASRFPQAGQDTVRRTPILQTNVYGTKMNIRTLTAIKVLSLAAMLCSFRSQALGEVGGNDQQVSELNQPRLSLRLEGEMGRRIQANLDNWLYPCPRVNPGLLEMFRMRDRTPKPKVTVDSASLWGKYLISAVQAMRMTDDPKLKPYIAELVKEFISTQAENGYLGVYYKHEQLFTNWDFWAHHHCILGLYMWYQETGDQAALKCALRAADLICDALLDGEKELHDTPGPEINTAIIHGLAILYRETGNDRYLQGVKHIQSVWEKLGGRGYYHQALDGVEFYQTGSHRWEILHALQGLSELYRITHDETYKQAQLHYWHSILKTDVHNAGSFSVGEQAVGNPFAPGPIETCCTVAWIAYSIDALRFSGDSKIADAIENATWNAMLGAQHPSGRWWTYDTPMDGKRLASFHYLAHVHSACGSPELNCCAVNGPRSLGMLSEWAFLGDAQQGLYLNYYGPGTIEVNLDATSKWTIRQKTEYPAEGTVHIEVDPDKSRQVALYLRIPAWSTKTIVAVNGKTIRNVQPGGYLKLDRTWKKKDRIDLKLDMGLRLLRGDENVKHNASLYRGPLLLTFDQKHNVIEPDDMPRLDFAKIKLSPVSRNDRFQPLALLRTTTVDGTEIFLTDYATAGAHGTSYRSWLPINGGL